MNSNKFLQRLIEVIGMIKAPAIIIVRVIALTQARSTVFIGDLDKRSPLFDDSQFDAYGYPDSLRG